MIANLNLCSANQSASCILYKAAAPKSNPNILTTMSTPNTSFTVDCPSAPRKPKKCGDVSKYVCLVRRPEEFIDNAAASPPYAEMMAIGNNGQYVVVKSYNGCLYVCIRNYYYKEALQRWMPSRTGLNLTFAEWKSFRSYRTTMLIENAKYQEVHRCEPPFKGNEMHEEQEPTSWPSELSDGTTIHRIPLSETPTNKYVVVSRHYSAFEDVMVSFVQLSDESSEIPDKGIHLSMYTYECLQKQSEYIDGIVDAEQLKIEMDFADKYF